MVKSKNHTEMKEAPHQTIFNKIVTVTIYGALILVALGIAILLFWSFQSEDVLTVNNSPVPVRTIREHPTADGVVILKVDYCKHIGATGRVRTSFVSASREIFLPVGEDKQPPECKLQEIPILIPHDTPPDMYKVKFRIDYRINPLLEASEEFESLPFEVRK